MKGKHRRKKCDLARVFLPDFELQLRTAATTASTQRKAFGSRVEITAKGVNNMYKDFASAERQKPLHHFALLVPAPPFFAI